MSISQKFKDELQEKIDQKNADLQKAKVKIILENCSFAAVTICSLIIVWNIYTEFV